MSAHYNLEPPPTASVLLHTSAGPITLSLFAVQTPLTTRNFLQHCLDGTYDGLPFHRVAAGFVVQTGDPTGTGEGGVSIYEEDKEFEVLDENWARVLGREVGERVVLGDEVHSRLRFGRRGLVGMAKGEGGGYGSQWFVTLGDVGRQLDGRCTMFGRVEGDGIYSVVRIAEGEVVEGSERPVYPETITKVEVLEMPKGEAWEAMRPRVKVAQRTVEEKKEIKKPPKKGKKAKAVLSFGDEDEGDVVVKPKKAKFNTALIDGPSTASDAVKANGAATKPVQPAARRRSPSPLQSTVPAKRKASTAASDAPPPSHHRKPSSPDPATQLPLRNPEVPSRSPSDSRSPSPAQHHRTSASKSKAALEDEIAALKASMRRPTTTVGDVSRKQSALEALIPSTSTRGRKRPRPGDTGGGSKEDAKALKMLNAFRARLEAADDEAPPPASKQRQANGSADKGVEAPAAAPDDDDEEARLCDLHFIANCASCFAAEQAEENDAAEAAENDNDRGFLGHSLHFARDVLGKDLQWRTRERNVDDDGGLVVIDPRAKEREIKEKGASRKGRRDHQGGTGAREWDKGRR